MKKLNIAVIRIDGGTQSRVEINNEAVADYAEAVRVGIEFPPVVVFHDGADYWLADGFHRYHAHKAAEKASIAADVREGTKRDAVLFSLGANGTHGLRRTNSDKRKAVLTVLQDAEWTQWSDRKIAEVCGVGAPLVGDVRRSICNPITDAPVVRTVERAGKVYQQNTSNIGKKAAPAKRTFVPEVPAEEALPDTHELQEAQDTIRDLAEENDKLRDKLAVEVMDASENDKLAAANTIEELRAQVKALEAELDAVKVSRDTYMREANEAKKQAVFWRKKAEKVGAAA